MHPLIQAALVEIHQDELMRDVQATHVLHQAGWQAPRRRHWLPSPLHRTLQRLRLRQRARRQRLARRRYATAWQRDLTAFLDDDHT